MAKRKNIDWESIEKEYRAGSLSVAEIARQNGITHPGILRRAKKFGWTRDLSKEVRKRINQKLVTDSVTICNASEDEIAEAASDRGADVVRLHRKDINALRQLETSLIAELQSSPTKLYITQYQGAIVEKVVYLTASERAQAANNLANVQHKRIQLERQAFNIDETPTDEDKSITVNWVKAPNRKDDDD